MAHPTLTFRISSMHIPKLRLNKIIAKEKNYLKMKSTLNRLTNNGIINSRLGIGLNNLGEKMNKERIRAFEFVIMSRNDDIAYKALIQKLKEEQIKNKWDRDFLLKLNLKSYQYDDKQDEYKLKDHIKINGSNITPNFLKACKNNNIKVNINEEQFLDSEMVKFMSKWLLYQLAEKNLNFNNLINRKRKKTDEDGEEIENTNYKKPVDIDYLMENYQI